MQKPTKFEIKGLFGDRDVSLPIENDALILVGPNGIGKSSVTNIYFLYRDNGVVLQSVTSLR